MKHIIILATFVMIGCNNLEKPIPENNKHSELDTFISKSQQNIAFGDSLNQKSDSIVGIKIEKTVDKIQKLESEVKQLKSENNELKEKLDDADDVGQPYRIRTISDN